jgi:hypothetical protein
MQQPPSPTPSADSTSSNWPSSPSYPTPLLKASRYSHGGPRTGSMGGAGPRVGSMGGAAPRASSLGGAGPRGSSNGNPGPRRSSSGGKGRTCSQKVVALLIAAAVLLGITLGLGLGLGFPQRQSAKKAGKGYALDGSLNGSYCTALPGSAANLCDAYLKATSNAKFAAASAWREESPETCEPGGGGAGRQG